MTGSSEATIRQFDRNADGPAVLRLNTAIETQSIFQVEAGKDSLCLKPTPIDASHRKEFPFDFDSDAWDQAFVAIYNGRVVGFIATEFQKWNRRLTVWHFYVDEKYRRQGVGRRLMNHALERGRTLGALTAWAETSNWNFPGVEAYRHLGFALCGFDLSLYSGTPSEGEFALFLASPIS